MVNGPQTDVAWELRCRARSQMPFECIAVQVDNTRQDQISCQINRSVMPSVNKITQLPFDDGKPVRYQTVAAQYTCTTNAHILNEGHFAAQSARFSTTLAEPCIRIMKPYGSASVRVTLSPANHVRPTSIGVPPVSTFNPMVRSTGEASAICKCRACVAVASFAFTRVAARV